MIFGNDHRIVSKLTESSEGIAIHSSNGITIKPGGVWQLPVIVREDSVLFFIFNTSDDMDVEFDLSSTMPELPSKPLSVISPIRCQKRQGEIDVHPGVYILRWSNAYSWLTSKTVLYAIFLASKSSLQTEQHRVLQAQISAQRLQRIAWIKSEASQLEDKLTIAHRTLEEGQKQRNQVVSTIVEVQSLMARLNQALNQANHMIDTAKGEIKQIQTQSQQLDKALQELEQNNFNNSSNSSSSNSNDIHHNKESYGDVVDEVVDGQVVVHNKTTKQTDQQQQPEQNATILNNSTTNTNTGQY